MKYINPLKDVKQEKKPLKKIFSFEILNLFAITIPKNKFYEIFLIKDFVQKKYKSAKRCKARKKTA